MAIDHISKPMKDSSDFGFNSGGDKIEKVELFGDALIDGEGYFDVICKKCDTKDFMLQLNISWEKIRLICSNPDCSEILELEI